MAYEHKPGSFALFKNDKGDNPKRPDYRGDGKDLDGNLIEVSAWLKNGKNGKFMSCSMKPKGERISGGLRQDADPNDEIPF